MNIANGIYVVRDILSLEECDEYIAICERVGFGDAPISEVGGEIVRPEIRNNARVMIDDEKTATLLWDRIKAEVPAFLNGRQVKGVNERLRFYRYDPGQQFAPHVDGSFTKSSGEQSLLTLMVYLNEAFEGGETIFNEAKINPQTGMALIFQHALMHEGAAVIGGRKYVLRSDVIYDVVGRLTGG
jgi:predicted 2-oxoglutarate/Fe(II)-dependent dioxygenase YbiX